MNIQYLKAGVPVVTSSQIEELAGNGIAPDDLQNRQPRSVGVVHAPVPDQRGDVWLVEHEGGKRAVYHHDELLPLSQGSMPQGFRTR